MNLVQILCQRQFMNFVQIGPKLGPNSSPLFDQFLLLFDSRYSIGNLQGMLMRMSVRYCHNIHTYIYIYIGFLISLVSYSSLFLLFGIFCSFKFLIGIIP